jgi:cell division septal protein FtsQ
MSIRDRKRRPRVPIERRGQGDMRRLLWHCVALLGLAIGFVAVVLAF